MGSTRVPGKVMRMLGGMPVLRWAIDAAIKAPGVDDVILATSNLPADDVITTYCARNGIPFYRGSESDVLDRFYKCAKKFKADIVLRFTADCPFLDPVVIGEVVKLREMTNADYASNCYPPTYPDGLDTECFTFKALEESWRETTSQVDRDCLTQFIVRNRSRYKVVNLTCPLPGLDKERWVLDTEADWEFCRQVSAAGKYRNCSYIGILRFLDKHPEIRKLNAGGIRNERFYEALADEPLSARTFERSQRIFARAIQAIPLGAQTFSKSHLQFPKHSPLYVSYGDGGYVFDVDGNRYVDLVGSLGSNILGYGDPDVNEAIRRQLDNGITLSLSTELEAELAELLRKHIPCAEMAKFGKSGTDVTTAAVRLARAYTGRDHVLVGGYHGWADWSVACTDRDHGIPEEIKKLSGRVGSNEYKIMQIGAYRAEYVAAIIVEPNDDPEYLQWLRDYCSKYGIILIFDEILTGFRYDLGGAQKLYGVTPDLACFGKAMANGMPISALVGKRQIMEKLNDPNVFYSGTFFGETLSIAAAIATIKKMESINIAADLCTKGIVLEKKILQLILNHKIIHDLDVLSLDGWYSNMKVRFKDDRIRSLFVSQMAQNGVLIINSNMLSYAHKKPELQRIIAAYDRTLHAIAEAIRDGSIDKVERMMASPVRTT